MIGTWPVVAMTLIRLIATRSTTASISDSVAFGSLSNSYTVRTSGGALVVSCLGLLLVTCWAEEEDGGGC